MHLYGFEILKLTNKQMKRTETAGMHFRRTVAGCTMAYHKCNKDIEEVGKSDNQ
jgi:hypothetical protein